MNPHPGRHHAFCRRVIGLVVGLSFLAISGCSVTYVPTYQKQIIQDQAHRQPALGWVYPPHETLKQLSPEAGLTGVVKPKPLPAFIPNREPAYVSGMTLLADGSVVCVSPSEYSYEAKQFTIATYYRERITRVQVNCFNGENGLLRWSTPLSVEGVYDLTEMKAILLLSAKKFDKMGAFIETNLIALDKTNGTIRWARRLTRPFRHFSISQEHHRILFSTKTESLDPVETVEALDTITGKTAWSAAFAVSEDVSEKRNVWPTIVGENILLFERGPSLRRLRHGEVIWSREDVELSGVAQPLVYDNTAWFQSSRGIMALDITSGNTRWVAPSIVGQLMKITFSGTHLFLSSSKEGAAAAKHSLAMIDPSSGEVRWQVATDPLLGNIVEDKQHVYFSTRSHLTTVRVTDGAKVRMSELPWEDEFTYHVLTLRGDTIAVRNEWNVALWKTADQRLVYHHRFDPLCPIMTTEDRMLEQRKLGASVSYATTNAASYNYYVNTAYYSSQFNQAMNNYRSTGDTSYLSSAQASYGMARNAMAQNRALAGMQFGLAMSNATMQLGTVVIKKKVQVTSSMVYPQIDAVMKKQRRFDTGDWVLRLVGVQIGTQRFSALESVHEPTGRSRKVFLSPSQMPSDLTTFARSPMTAQELNGYYSASMYLGHAYSTVVDLERDRIFHYGPGLNVNEYVTYGQTGFLRGRLWCFDANLRSGS